MDHLCTERVELSNRIDILEQDVLLKTIAVPFPPSSLSAASPKDHNENKSTTGIRKTIPSAGPEKKEFLSGFDQWFALLEKAPDEKDRSDGLQENGGEQSGLDLGSRASNTGELAVQSQFVV